MKEVLRALLSQVGQLRPESGSPALGLGIDVQAQLGSIPPSPETPMPSVVSESSHLVILVCHSGSMPFLAQAMATEIVKLGRGSGWMVSMIGCCLFLIFI